MDLLFIITSSTQGDSKGAPAKWIPIQELPFLAAYLFLEGSSSL